MRDSTRGPPVWLFVPPRRFFNGFQWVIEIRRRLPRSRIANLPWLVEDADMPSRDELASAYLDQLPFEPYPVQEEALLSWFSTDEGTLV